MLGVKDSQRWKMGSCLHISPWVGHYPVLLTGNKVRIQEHMDFCLNFCKSWCFTGAPRDRAKFTNSLSWLLGRDLDKEIWSHVCFSLYIWLWWAVGSPPPGLQHVPDAHHYLLWKGPVGLLSPLASDRCGLLWLSSLTQDHKSLIIYLYSSSFTLLFWELQRIFVNHLNCASNCPHVVEDTRY